MAGPGVHEMAKSRVEGGCGVCRREVTACSRFPTSPPPKKKL